MANARYAVHAIVQEHNASMRRQFDPNTLEGKHSKLLLKDGKVKTSVKTL
jgi:hypothetical protein